MVKDASTIAIKKPVAIYKREMTFDWKNIFVHTSKTIGNFFIKGIDGAALSAGDLVNDLGLKQQPEQVAWLLVFQSITANLACLINDSLDLFKIEPSNEHKEQLGEHLNLMLESNNYYIDNQFFDAPQNAQFTRDFLTPLAAWLKQLGLEQAPIHGLINRFKANLPLALHNQWARNSELFTIITVLLNTPFSKTSEKQRQWYNYHLWLKSQINERMLGEAFSLNDIYVEPSAYYITNEKHVDIDLHSRLNAWASKFNPKDAFRVVTGGPGAGKSSMAKMLAVNWSETLNIPILLIPLHHFNMTTDILTAVQNFINGNKYLTGNPFAPDIGEQRLILIFDGLDELAEQGRQGIEMAKDFIMSLVNQVNQHNNQGCYQQVLVTGRDISINSIANHFRGEQQIYHLQGFDEQQQNLWWQQYGKASGQYFKNMPSDLKQERLTDILTQPLLSYLVALSYIRGKIVFNSQTNLNQIYQDLIDSVYEREQSKQINNAASELSRTQFIRILEEIAIAIWRGHGRTATVRAIEARCYSKGLLKSLSAFKFGAENGVTKLLTAFYFRQANHIINDKTFEFTHKSFGEFLTAKRIVRLIKRICTQLERKNEDPDDGWTVKQSLAEWAKITGPTPIDDYLHSYIKDEILLAGESECEIWQENILKLLNYSINHGLPMEGLSDLCFPQMLTQARNTDESLLVLLNACAITTKKPSKIETNNKAAFGIWFRRLQPQREPKGNCIAFSCLSYLDLSGSILTFQDFYDANISNSILNGIRAECSHISNANLFNTNLSNAVLSGVSLKHADLSNANLTNTKLISADLRNAYLRTANLTNADLTGARVNFRYHDKSIFSSVQLNQIIEVETDISH